MLPIMVISKTMTQVDLTYIYSHTFCHQNSVGMANFGYRVSQQFWNVSPFVWKQHTHTNANECMWPESQHWTAMNHSANLKQHGWLSTFFSRNQNLFSYCTVWFSRFFPPRLHSNLPTTFKKNDIKWNKSVFAPLVLQGNSGNGSTLQWRRRPKLLVYFLLCCHLHPSSVN